jgi:hypothetical protein
MHSATVCSAEPSSTKLDVPIYETGGSEISRILDEASKMTTTGPDDWSTPLIRYLENSGHITDRKVWWQALKYVVLDNTLYRRTIGEVHKGICGTHQSAHKMKWLLRRTGFY